MITQQRAVVQMPDLVGLSLRKARFLAENAGLVVDDVVFQESYHQRDTVLGQRPARGQMIYAGERVTLGVSRESYAKWLPAIYQRSDLNGRNFVRDLLWIVQHLFSSIDEVLEVGHTFYDPYEAPEAFLPWLAAWTAMVLDEDWPVSKKRRLIKRAVELYRIRGTVRGLKLFISLFTGHEPEILENTWPFRGWRMGVTSELGVDTVVLPPVNLAHTFVVEMPLQYEDLSVQAVVRIHEIIQMEKPANTQYYLRFAVEQRGPELREFFAIGTRSGINIGSEIVQAGGSEEASPLGRPGQGGSALAGTAVAAAPRSGGTGLENRLTGSLTAIAEGEDDFPAYRGKPPLPKAPRADTAPVEGKEVRSREEGFGASARVMQAVEDGTGARTSAATRATPARDAEPAAPVERPSLPAAEVSAPMADNADTVETEVDDEPTRLVTPSTDGAKPIGRGRGGRGKDPKKQ